MHKPFASIIIPTFCDWLRLKQCLSAISNQTYGTQNFEVIIVNNAPYSPCPYDKLEQNVHLVAESKKGSYAARNKGIDFAKGDIIVFTDSDCTPTHKWLEAGVSTLIEENADLVGGLVTFTFSSTKPSAAEIIDSITNMQIERDILTRGAAKTANLFVRRSVILELGCFPSDILSGGDVIWTRAATDAGYKLVFSLDAEVLHPARSWLALFRKQIRVGRGQIRIMRENGVKWHRVLIDSASMRRGVKSQRSKPELAPSLLRRIKLTFALLWIVAATLLGRIIAIIRG